MKQIIRAMYIIISTWTSKGLVKDPLQIEIIHSDESCWYYDS